MFYHDQKRQKTHQQILGLAHHSVGLQEEKKNNPKQKPNGSIDCKLQGQIEKIPNIYIHLF